MEQFGDGHYGYHKTLWREPANFLDVGEGPPENGYRKFQTHLSDPNVKRVLVNFSEALCAGDIIAEGLWLRSKIHFDDPSWLRLEGTNVDLGKNFCKSGLPILLPR